MLIKLPKNKQVYLFEVDDILYPKRDFLLQIYYLFGQFVEYTEGRAISADIVQFMKETYEKDGEQDLLAKTQKQFALAQDYSENFERLQANGHLPLKLILFDEIKTTFEELKGNDKNIAILTKGNPVLQLNKLKHIDWEGWEKHLKIYFTDELTFRNIEPFGYIAHEFGVEPNNIYYLETH